MRCYVRHTIEQREIDKPCVKMTIEPRQENNYIENTEKRKPTEEEW